MATTHLELLENSFFYPPSNPIQLDRIHSKNGKRLLKVLVRHDSSPYLSSKCQPIRSNWIQSESQQQWLLIFYFARRIFSPTYRNRPDPIQPDPIRPDPIQPTASRGWWFTRRLVWSAYDPIGSNRIYTAAVVVDISDYLLVRRTSGRRTDLV